MEEEAFVKNLKFQLAQFKSFSDFASFVKQNVYPSFDMSVHDLYVERGKGIEPVELDINFEDNIDEFKDNQKLKINIVVRQIEVEE